MTKQIIRQNGKPAFVVVPFKEWQRIEEILEDRADAAAVRAYWENPDEEGFPDDIVGKLLDGVNPIKVFREYRGMTQAELAGKAELSSMYLSQLERGERRPGRKALGKLAAALRVDVDMLER
jgi:DNA-binding XRE family transcriptional regulator